MGQVITLLLIGIISGIISGMFGISGSILASPFLRLFIDITAISALATPLITSIPSAVSASVIYHKEKKIIFKLAFTALLTAIPFSLLGTWSTNFIDSDLLLIAKAGFLFFLGLNFVLSGWILIGKEIPIKFSFVGGLISGIIAGYLAGILAVGGGIVLVTAFVRVNNLQMKNAIATSMLCVGVLSAINSYVHYKFGNIDIIIAIILCITVIPFSYLGAKLAMRLKNKTLEKIFGIILICFSLYFIVVQLSRYFMY